jgi:DivIVA domain-containing protein
VDWRQVERLRSPGFPTARRGYDKREVDKFLAQLVDWLETDAAGEIGQVAVTRKLELIGKSTAHILLTAEQEAQELTRQAHADSEELRAEAQADAHEVHVAADVYARQTRTEADEEARRTRHAADADASQTIEEGLRRRSQINDEIRELEAQRARVLEELARLRAELGGAIDHHQPAAGNGEPATSPPAARPASRR